MAHVVSDDCINCGACEAVCPVNAISENSSKRDVDASSCIDCCACEGECPVGAINQE